jgi:hypothetical protein
LNLKKRSKKRLKKSLLKKFENITNCRREGRGGEGWGGEGGWRIVIPMPEAINFVYGRRQKCFEGVYIYACILLDFITFGADPFYGQT